MEQEDVHVVYPVSRGVFLAVLIPMTLGYWYQIYLDRRELRVLENWWKAHRAFRVGGCIGTTAFTVAQVDFFGVFGIYPPIVPSVLFCIAGALMALPVWFACYVSAVVASSFVSWKQKQRIVRWSLVTFVITGPIQSGFIVAAGITSNAVVRLIMFVIGVPVVATMIFGTNYLHYLLRRHLKDMEKSRAIDGTTSSAAISLRDRVRRWRNYSITITIAGLTMLPIFLLRAQSLSALIRNGVRFESGAGGVNAISSPSELPPAIALIMMTASIPILVVFLRRSWRTVDSDMPQTTTNSSARSNNVASRHADASRRASTEISDATQLKNSAGRGSIASKNVDVSRRTSTGISHTTQLIAPSTPTAHAAENVDSLCPQCAMDLPTKAALKRHFTVAHPENKNSELPTDEVHV